MYDKVHQQKWALGLRFISALAISGPQTKKTKQNKVMMSLTRSLIFQGVSKWRFTTPYKDLHSFCLAISRANSMALVSAWRKGAGGGQSFLEPNCWLMSPAWSRAPTPWPATGKNRISIVASTNQPLLSSPRIRSWEQEAAPCCSPESEVHDLYDNNSRPASLNVPMLPCLWYPKIARCGCVSIVE